MNMEGQSRRRTFLVVVDDSAEMHAALRYACRRARHTGGAVALLRVIEPGDYHHFLRISRLMQDEARAEAEQLLGRLAGEVNALSGCLPVLHVREGKPRDAVLALLKEEPAISVLVLAAGTGPQGPGPLIDALTGRDIHRLRVPLTIIPGQLTDTDIDALS